MGGGNNGPKAKFFDNKNVLFYGHVDIPENYTYKINGPALAKGDVGLGNVDDTADSAKPVSTAQQTALDLKAPYPTQTTSSTLAWTSTTQALSVTCNAKSGQIPVSVQFSISNGQYCSITLTNSEIDTDSVVVLSTYMRTGHVPAYIVQRPAYATAGVYNFRAAGSDGVDLSSNTAISFYINFMVL